MPKNAPKLNILKSFQISDVIGQITGVVNGVGFVLFVKEGFLDILEGFSYGEEAWPTKILEYRPSYISGGCRDTIEMGKKLTPEGT